MAGKKEKKVTLEEVIQKLSKLLGESRKPIFFRSGGRKVRLELESKQVTFDLIPKKERSKRDVR